VTTKDTVIGPNLACLKTPYDSMLGGQVAQKIRFRNSKIWRCLKRQGLPVAPLLPSALFLGEKFRRRNLRLAE
jgi:hypothetical protein